MEILLVEDHVDSARVLSKLIELRGHSTTIANSCREALQIFDKQSFDLAILDIGLPDGNGCDLLHSLLNIREVKTIALTGYAMPTDISSLLRAGFDHYLVKPVEVTELYAALDDFARIDR